MFVQDRQSNLNKAAGRACSLVVLDNPHFKGELLCQDSHSPDTQQASSYTQRKIHDLRTEAHASEAILLFPQALMKALFPGVHFRVHSIYGNPKRKHAGGTTFPACTAALRIAQSGPCCSHLLCSRAGAVTVGPCCHHRQ